MKINTILTFNNVEVLIKYALAYIGAVYVLAELAVAGASIAFRHNYVLGLSVTAIAVFFFLIAAVLHPYIKTLKAIQQIPSYFWKAIVFIPLISFVVLSIPVFIAFFRLHVISL